MFRISKAAMDTSLERSRAKITELEAKIADLRIAEREIRALEKLTSRKTRPGAGPKPKRKPEASNQAEARETIGSAIADVLGQQGALSAAEIAEAYQGRRIAAGILAIVETNLMGARSRVHASSHRATRTRHLRS
jgi:hypothetical protein